MGTQLVICAPLRIEYAAVRRGVRSGGVRARGIHSGGAAQPAATLVRIGMGPAKAARAHAGLAGDGPVAVLGVAGGLAPDLRVPDLVVASRVITTDGFAIDCPLGAEVAERLAAAGLPVHLGTIVSVPKIVEGAERTELAERHGALACDMESGYLAERLAPGRPLVVVRALSDSVTQPLLSPRIFSQGAAALGNVRRAAAVVCQWAGEGLAP